MIFRPAESSKNIVDFYRRYLLTTFITNRDYYNSQLEEKIKSDGAISNGPFISMTDSYEKYMSIRELVDEGILCKSMLKLTALNIDRKLYRHQVESIRKAVTGKNLVITTGTGSGKTECFLIPVLNQIMCEHENGNLNSGVRTLIIYPMNALVNDQIRRIRDIFKQSGVTDITFGRYTGETKNTYARALDDYKSLFGYEPEANELISREQMKNTPPNILITNYAMLEYLLLRPGDNVFFNETNAPKWQNIVLDEAHSYSGATGIEVGSLLRRLKATLRRPDIRFMLTSATLGDKNDDEKIVEFANNLTDAAFDVGSIVRSTVVAPKMSENPKKISLSVYKELAEKIRDNASSDDVLSYLSGKGVTVVNSVNSEKSLEETLFNMILEDMFYYDVRKVLLNKTKSLTETAEELNVSVEYLTDFISVASNAALNGDKIFDAKYHMFIRGIEGVYVTLAPRNKLFIRKKDTDYENDDDDIGYKVFEISFCHNCGSIYIVGQIDNDYLVQKSKYNDDYSPEVFLLDGNLDDEESFQDEYDENAFVICSRCGKITRVSSTDEPSCGHGKQYQNRVIRVKEKGKELHSCPCCHVINTQRSIIRPYLLGNEAATAVIATGLYNELPSEIVKKTKVKSEDVFFGLGETETEIEEKTDLVKQFLAFSDNRQAAAFFSSYLNNTYQNTLIKRIMAEIAKQNSHEMKNGIDIYRFIDELEMFFFKTKLFKRDDCRKQAWLATIKEMTNYKATNSLQNKGIIYFDIDIKSPKEISPFSAEQVTELLKSLAMFFIKSAAIKLPVETHFTQNDILEFSFGTGELNGFVKDYIDNKYIKSWLPFSGKENPQMRLVKRVFSSWDSDKVRMFLESVWSLFIQEKIIVWEDIKGTVEYFLNIDKIKVKTVDKLYICDECRFVTPHLINGVCSKCGGALSAFDYERSLKKDHYKYLYEHTKIEKLISKEHTAQLNSDKAYTYQNDFKMKKINVLSCSTTFEMGVDVGSLETVFMRNMPPSPANYAQRAGRAGRSAKAAAYAITYCPNSSHDLNYFKDPVAMIKGTIIPPIFNVSNEKIVLRHIFASAFSFFWKSQPDFYTDTIGEFFEKGGYDKFKQYLEGEPESLKNYLCTIISDELQLFYDTDNFGWTDKLFSEREEEPGVFFIAKKNYDSDYASLSDAFDENIKVQEKEKGTKKAERAGSENKAISWSMNTIKKEKIISFLSKNNLIPKYGFPVDSVELKSITSNNVVNNLSLSRDLFTAISEYAPGSQIVADDHLITSRYIKKMIGYEWPRYKYAFCSECNTLNKVLYTENLPELCKQCGAKLKAKGVQREYIIPKFGFIVDNDGIEEVGINKPEKTYKGEVAYIGDGAQIENKTFVVNGNYVEVGTSKMDRLAVLNRSSFYICDNCGYGEVFEGKYDKFVEKKHKRPTGHNCTNSILRPCAIGHEFQTDVVQIKFTSENISDINRAWTILYSLVEGLSKSLNIDRNELSGCLHYYNNPMAGNIGNYDFIIFDNTPGGAGYVRQLHNKDAFRKMLSGAERIVNECDCGGLAADSVCYGCLCNYYNQKQHEIMKRSYAIEFFNSVKCGKNCWQIEEAVIN